MSAEVWFCLILMVIMGARRSWTLPWDGNMEHVTPLPLTTPHSAVIATKTLSGAVSLWSVVLISVCQVSITDQQVSSSSSSSLCISSSSLSTACRNNSRIMISTHHILIHAVILFSVSSDTVSLLETFLQHFITHEHHYPHDQHFQNLFMIITKTIGLKTTCDNCVSGIMSSNTCVLSVLPESTSGLGWGVTLCSLTRAPGTTDCPIL